MNKSIIHITLEKNGFDVVMHLRVAAEIEDFFRTASNNAIETSKVWLNENNSGLKFYKKSEKVATRVSGIEVIDHFGSSLFSDNNFINIALLRTVGASEGITIKTSHLLSYEEMKSYIEELAIWTRGFYESTMQPAGISATIGFKV